MLFERARSVHTFGMREEIVVAFLDQEHEVIRVTTVPPRRIVWSLRARHILEGPVGTDLRSGDRLGRYSPRRFAMRRRWISLVPL